MIASHQEMTAEHANLFSIRYIPIGILEQIPQRINERPPYYVGRNDLETLMASPNSNDWVKLR